MTTKNKPELMGLLLLVLVNLAVLLLSVAQALETGVPTITIDWSFVPISLTDSLANGSLMDIGYDLLTLLTSTFLHGSFEHFGSNMLMLFLFGILVERQLGTMRFLAIYLASGVLGALGHYLIDIMSPHPLIGASGAVSGIMAAFIVCVFGSGKRPTILSLVGTAFILQWLFEEVSSLMVSAAPGKGPAVAHDVHVIGFALGLIMSIVVMVFMRRKARSGRRKNTDVQIIDWDALYPAIPDKTVEQEASARPREEHPDAVPGALDKQSPPTAETSPAVTASDRTKTGSEQPETEGRSETFDRSAEVKVISPPKSPNENLQAPACEAAPSVTRVVQTGYQPDKNDNLFE